jgi:xylulokinase
MSEQAAPCEPDAAAHERYRREHAVFLDAYRRLEPWFESL